MHQNKPQNKPSNLASLSLPWPAASFFGASYISLPLQEAKSSTEITLRLKTHRADSLLLLAAGTTDYCLVVLEGGALRVSGRVGGRRGGRARSVERRWQWRKYYVGVKVRERDE